MHCRKLAHSSAERNPSLAKFGGVTADPATARNLGEVLRALPMWSQSFAYLRQHGLRHYHLAGPAVLLGLTGAGWKFSEWLSDWVTQFLHGLLGIATAEATSEVTAPPSTLSNTWNDLLMWGNEQVDSLVDWGVFLFVLWLKVKAAKYLLITLMAPFMSALASAVRSVETQSEIPFSWKGLLKDLIRGIRISFVLLFMEIALGLLLWILGIGLTLTTGPLGILLSPLLVALSWLAGAYFFGAAVFDAVYEQAGLGWRESLKTGWSQRSHLLGLGAIFSLLLGIPWVGPYVAALLGPVPCTTAAARLYFRSTPDKP